MKLQTVDYNKLGPMETKILDLWASGIHQPVEIVNAYNAKYAIENGVRKIRTVDVGNCIRKIKKLILKETVDDLKQIITDEYFFLYQEALAAWINSKEEEITIIENRSENDKGYNESVTEKRKAQVGDPRHLSNAAKMLQSLREMTGIDSPKKIEHILKEEMVLIMQYFQSALEPAVYEKVLLSLKNYNTENVVDIEIEEV